MPKDEQQQSDPKGSDDTQQQASTETEAPKPAPPARDETDWKAESRKWEQRAKENSKAAERLAEIENASKTEAQRAADAQKAAEERAVAAEARATRREIALEFKLDAKDARLLDSLTDEDAMRSLAERLATPEEPAPVGVRVDQSGRQATTKPDEDELARAFFGLGT